MEIQFEVGVLKSALKTIWEINLVINFTQNLDLMTSIFETVMSNRLLVTPTVKKLWVIPTVKNSRGTRVLKVLKLTSGACKLVDFIAVHRKEGLETGNL